MHPIRPRLTTGQGVDAVPAPRAPRRTPRWRVFVCVAALGGCLVLSTRLGAEEGTPQQLVVGTRHIPPFAIRHEDGSWSGLSIELWRAIAADLQITYELREVELAELLTGLQDGSLDVAVAALTVTADREKVIDFTHPFHSSGLGIAVGQNSAAGWTRLASRLFTADLAKVLGVLAILLAATGFLVWMFERRRNPEQFGGDLVRGVGTGFWWSAVTMTTVGYGDKAPRSLGGRLLAVIWMFTGILVISSFTAAITSSLTVARLESRIRGPQDLPGLRVATVPGSTSEAYLEKKHIPVREYASPLEGLGAVASGEVDAVVYDAPILRYLASKELHGTVRVLPHRFEPQSYAMGLPAGSGLREPMNRVLLSKIAEPWWQDVLYRYLEE